MDMELRFHHVELRTDKDNKMVVSGYVNKTDQFSEVLGVTKKFREKIAKGAFSKAVKDAIRDIDFLAEHNSKLILASTRNDSLKLLEDEQGLYMSATITPTSWGKDYYELISSGILKNMSFGFRAIKDSWQKSDNQIYERTIEELELFEVSVVKDPAYSQSTIAARGINLVGDVPIPSLTQINKHNIKEKKQQMRELDKMTEIKEDYKLFETFLREHRNLQTTVEGSGLIPSSVHKEIILKMEETAPVFARAKKFKSVHGSLTIAKENDLLEAGFVGEGKDVIEGALSFEEVKLNQKRYGAVITLTNQLINDSGVNIVGYVTELLARRVGKLAEQSILTGSSSNEFKGIIHDQEINEIRANGLITIDQLLNLYNSIHPDYLEGSTFIIQRKLYNQIAKLKDEAGHPYIQNGFVNGKLTYTLFGLEIIVTGSLPDDVPILFGNIEKAYAVMIKRDQGIMHVHKDTKNAMAGTQTFLYDMYADGAVYNPQAIAKLTLN